LWFFENDNDKSGDGDVDPSFEFGDEIETFKYTPLVKVIYLSVISRIVEDENTKDSYTDLLEEGDSEDYLWECNCSKWNWLV
jgi:hypothetical protein